MDNQQRQLFAQPQPQHFIRSGSDERSRYAPLGSYSNGAHPTQQMVYPGQHFQLSAPVMHPELYEVKKRRDRWAKWVEVASYLMLFLAILDFSMALLTYANTNQFHDPNQNQLKLSACDIIIKAVADLALIGTSMLGFKASKKKDSLSAKKYLRALTLLAIFLIASTIICSFVMANKVEKEERDHFEPAPFEDWEFEEPEIDGSSDVYEDNKPEQKKKPAENGTQNSPINYNKVYQSNSPTSTDTDAHSIDENKPLEIKQDQFSASVKSEDYSESNPIDEKEKKNGNRLLSFREGGEVADSEEESKENKNRQLSFIGGGHAEGYESNPEESNENKNGNRFLHSREEKKNSKHEKRERHHRDKDDKDDKDDREDRDDKDDRDEARKRKNHRRKHNKEIREGIGGKIYDGNTYYDSEETDVMYGHNRNHHDVSFKSVIIICMLINVLCTSGLCACYIVCARNLYKSSKKYEVLTQQQVPAPQNFIQPMIGQPYLMQAFNSVPESPQGQYPVFSPFGSVMGQH